MSLKITSSLSEVDICLNVDTCPVISGDKSTEQIGMCTYQLLAILIELLLSFTNSICG